MTTADLFRTAGFERDGWVSDGYGTLRVDAAACPAGLLEDIHGYLAARWISGELRAVFEQGCHGARVYGPLGTFDGVLGDAMPNYWRDTGTSSAGQSLFQPDARHPVGKWFADAAQRLLPLPSPEVIDGILRRHGIEFSREPMPQLHEIEGGFAILLHKPKTKKAGLPDGVTRDDSLLALWRG